MVESECLFLVLISCFFLLNVQQTLKEPQLALEIIPLHIIDFFPNNKYI
jgi:hypothetical protein